MEYQRAVFGNGEHRLHPGRRVNRLEEALGQLRQPTRHHTTRSRFTIDQRMNGSTLRTVGLVCYNNTDPAIRKRRDAVAQHRRTFGVRVWLLLEWGFLSIISTRSSTASYTSRFPGMDLDSHNTMFPKTERVSR